MSADILEIFWVLVFVIEIPTAFAMVLTARWLFGKGNKEEWKQIVVSAFILAAVFYLSSLFFDQNKAVKGLVVIIALCVVYRFSFAESWATSMLASVLMFFLADVVDISGYFIQTYYLHIAYLEAGHSTATAIISYWPGILLILGLALGIRSFMRSSVFNRLKMPFAILKESRLLLASLILQFLVMNVLLADFYWGSGGGHSLPINVGATVLFTTVYLTSFVILYQALKLAEKKAIRSMGEIIGEQVRNLSYSIKAQRHDFINHIQVMTALAHSGNNIELYRYIDRLGDDVQMLNEAAGINNPIISALVNAKMTQASARGIRFEVECQADLSGYVSESLDLVRIMGNLIDNAADAVAAMDGLRWIQLSIVEHGPLIEMKLVNPGSLDADPEILFKPGYTSKDSQHAGLGLYVVKNLADKLNGRVICSVESGPVVAFSLQLPKT